MEPLTIGKLAKATGVSVDTLRYYEKIRLLKAQRRTASGYRLYHPEAVRIVRFIRGAQALHFTLQEIHQLLSLDASDRATCAQIMEHTQNKIAEAETKIEELKELKNVLQRLLKQCPGGDVPLTSCPILGHIKKGGALAMLAAAVLGGCMPRAEAKPISYVGGTMIMQENDETGRTVSMDYTLTPNYAVGLYAKEEESGMHYTTITPELNSLLKRWNMKSGQANIFNSTGVGVTRYRNSDHAAVWTSMLADYETRRVFGSYEVRLMDAAGVEKSFWQRGRVGVAPYLANYDDINTWLMLQVDHHPTKDHSVVVTPLVRFYYHTTLVEAGFSSIGSVMFNWVLQL